MDARYPVLRPWIRSAEARGKCRNDDWNTTTKTGVEISCSALEMDSTVFSLVHF